DGATRFSTVSKISAGSTRPSTRSSTPRASGAAGRDCAERNRPTRVEIKRSSPSRSRSLRRSLDKGPSTAIFNQSVEYMPTHALDLAFAALADPTRRQIVRRLAKGTARVTDLAEPFNM